jgi:hypothetical protein
MLDTIKETNMPMLIPTPVTIAELSNIASPINVFDAALNPTVLAPRQRLDEVIVVAVTDDLLSPGSLWVQNYFGGEWTRGGAKQGTGALVADISGLLYNWVITPQVVA